MVMMMVIMMIVMMLSIFREMMISILKMMMMNILIVAMIIKEDMIIHQMHYRSWSCRYKYEEGSLRYM